MLIDTKCPCCGAELRIDSGYLGAKRKCRECGEAFVFEMQAEGGDRGLDSTDFAMQKVACHRCLRVADVKGIFREKDHFPCAYCGEMLERTTAEAYVAELDRLHETTRTLLLAGQTQDQVARALQAMALPPAEAEMLAEQTHGRLPFLRHEIYSGDADARSALGPPSECDLCLVHLDRRDAGRAYLVNWRKKVTDEEFEVERINAGAIIAATLMYFVDRMLPDHSNQVIDRPGVYVMCEPCRKSLTSFFGRYDGPHAAGGFKVTKITPVHDLKRP